MFIYMYNCCLFKLYYYKTCIIIKLLLLSQLNSCVYYKLICALLAWLSVFFWSRVTHLIIEQVSSLFVISVPSQELNELIKLAFFTLGFSAIFWVQPLPRLTVQTSREMRLLITNVITVSRKGGFLLVWERLITNI